MYKISHEKCICFVFLVILAILSCTGFRIDNLAMTDVSKRNFHSSPTIDRLFHVPHRMRHHRRHHVRPHVEALVFPPTTQPSEHLAQVPSTDLQNTLIPTKPVISRSQRSPEHRRNNKQGGKWLSHQEDHISLKAYKAEIVLLASTESCNATEGLCVFKIHKIYKNTKQFALTNRIMLTMHNALWNRKFVLFLNASTSSNFRSVGEPKLVKAKNESRTDKIIKHACRSNLAPTIPKVELKDITRKQGKRRLLCKVKGFPVPKIVWRRKGEVLRQNRHMVIQYKRKQSRLIIKKMDADHMGSYECVAEGADGSTVSRDIEVSSSASSPSESISSEKKCSEEYRDYCSNGGTCLKEDWMKEMYCICPPGYTGQTCAVKEPSSRLLDMRYMPDPFESQQQRPRTFPGS